jgi:hypothetical protein
MGRMVKQLRRVIRIRLERACGPRQIRGSRARSNRGTWQSEFRFVRWRGPGPTLDCSTLLAQGKRQISGEMRQMAVGVGVRPIGISPQKADLPRPRCRNSLIRRLLGCQVWFAFTPGSMGGSSGRPGANLGPMAQGFSGRLSVAQASRFERLCRRPATLRASAPLRRAIGRGAGSHWLHASAARYGARRKSPGPRACRPARNAAKRTVTALPRRAGWHCN